MWTIRQVEKKIKTLHNPTTHSNGGQECDIAQLIYFLCTFACKIAIRRCIFNLLLYHEHFLMSLNSHWNSIFSWLCNIPMSRAGFLARILFVCCPEQPHDVFQSIKSAPKPLTLLKGSEISLPFFSPSHTKATQRGKGTNPLFQLDQPWDASVKERFLNLLLPPNSPKTRTPLPSACSVDVFPFYLLL